MRALAKSKGGQQALQGRGVERGLSLKEALKWQYPAILSSAGHPMAGVLGKQGHREVIKAKQQTAAK